MEENLLHSNLDFLKILEKFTLDSKLLTCQKYSSRIMSSSQVDMDKAYNENIMAYQVISGIIFTYIGENVLRFRRVNLLNSDKVISPEMPTRELASNGRITTLTIHLLFSVWQNNHIRQQ